MENFDQPLDVGLDPGEAGEGLEITPIVRNMWRELSGWTMFLGILFFIVSGLFTLFLLLVILVTGGRGEAIGSAFALLLVSGLIFFPGWCYFKFATLMRQSLRYESSASLEAGFGYLKRYYRFIGILTIIIFAIYLMALAYSTATGSGATTTPEF